MGTAVVNGMDTLKTGEVAKLCGVAMRTVGKWIDSGLLSGTRVPGSQHRRVYPDELVRFLVRHRMRMPAELARWNRIVLLVGPAAAGCVAEFAAAGWEVVTADTPYLAGLRTAEARPAAIVVDLAGGILEAEAIRWGADPIPVILYGRHERWSGPDAADPGGVVAAAAGCVGDEA